MIHEFNCPVALRLYRKLPGVIWSEPPRQVTITPDGGDINLEEEMGVSLCIPKNATAQNKQLDLAVSFSEAHEMPDGMKPVSPGYIIATGDQEKMQFKKNILLKLQHTAHLATAEDCKDMVVLKAILPPLQQSGASSPVSRFEEMKGGSVDFNQGMRRHGIIRRKHLSNSVIKIAKRKRKGKATGR